MIRKTETVQYDAAAEVTTVRKGRKLTGERVVAMRWLGDNPKMGVKAGDLTLRHIDGDGRIRGDFTAHDERVIPGGTDADIEAYIAERLGQ